MVNSFDKVFMGAAGGVDLPSDDQFNRVSFLSHFDGANNGVNNAFDDGSASNHTITANGNVSQGSFGPFARPDGEWSFNNTGSTNDSFKVTAHDNFDMTNPFTIEGWIFIPDLAVNKLLFGRENNYWMTHDYQGIGGASGKLGFSYQNSGSWGTINASAATVANTWYFLQATYVGTTVTFYINGVSQGTASVGSPSSNTDKPFYVLSGPGAKATGTASNVRLSSVARSTSLPTAKFTSDSDTELLVCQSNRFVDNGPDGHTITTTAGASVSAFGPFLTSAVYDAAVNGASAYLDGSGDYLTISASADFNFGTGDATLECWIYPASSVGMLFATGNASSSDQFGIFNSSEGLWWGQTSSNSSRPSGNQWAHVAVSREGNTIRRYINGVQASTGTNTGSIGSSSATAYVGRRPSGGHEFGGYIADLRVVKGTAVYTGASAFTPPTAPLTAITNTKLLLNMADGQAIDSAAQNNLTLAGTAKTSTAQKKFGDASILFDGNSDYAYTTVSTPIGAGDYTVECFVYFNTVEYVGVWQFDDVVLGSQAYHGPVIFTGNDTDPKWATMTQHGSNQSIYSTSGPSADQWYHVANVRTNGVVKIFVDGTQIIDDFADTTDYSARNKLTLGAFYDSEYYFDGYIDEFRVSQFARYTSNFTAPSEPFADKGQ